MFRQFFGEQSPEDGQPRLRREEGLGSGVIISPDGYILTANHVVSGADEIKVAIADDNKKEYTAKVIGTDPQTDVAVLKIEAAGLPAITLADSDHLEIGDVVLAIGNPLGLGQSVTMGIISGLGRHVRREWRAWLRKFHPDRCGHQQGQFRRRARGCGRPAHRHQYLRLPQQRRQ